MGIMKNIFKHKLLSLTVTLCIFAYLNFKYYQELCLKKVYTLWNIYSCEECSRPSSLHQLIIGYILKFKILSSPCKRLTEDKQILAGR